MSEKAETPTMQILDRRIGPGEPVYVIAEMSANHAHELDRALRIVHAAKEAGADAIKLQTYTADTITLDADRPEFRVGHGTLWEGRTLHDLYDEAHTPWEWHAQIFDLARSLGLHAFSSPFDDTAVDFLESLDVPAYKIASFEIVDLPLIARVARTGKPMIMSTGMATLDEIEAAYTTALDHGATDLAILRCNSAYPASPGEMDLATIPHMAKSWNVPIGLSDHTLGPAAAIAGVALGASLIEKHITLDRATDGPDAAFSTEPDEFKALVQAVQQARQAVGRIRYGPTEHERPSLAFRRSLFAVADIAPGEPFTTDNVRSIRPAGGLPPAELDRVLGRKAAHAIDRGTPLAWSMVGAPAD